MLKGLITAEAVKDKSDIFNVQMGDTHADIRRSCVWEGKEDI